jgi:lysophospholipase L1-like esterase
MKAALQSLALAVVPVVLLLLVAEGLVRATGAADSCPNRFSKAGIWACDPVLHFKLRAEFWPKQGFLDASGFRSAGLGPRRPEVLRVLALGDSCTFGFLGGEEFAVVQQPYPQKLGRLAARRLGEDRLEVLNAGVPGYNSRHGVLLLRTKLRGVDPDLITVRYGWNDHFLSAPGEAALYREPATRLGRAVEDVVLRFRLYAFLRRISLELRAWRQPPSDQAQVAFEATREWSPTVPIEDFERNLRRIVEIGRSRGAEVWLLTAPTNPEPSDGARAVVSERNRLDFDALMQVHARYNDAVRRVGLEQHALVIDLEAIYRRHASAPLFHASDALHPSQAGHTLEAEVLYQALLRRGWLDPPAGAGAAAAEASPG